MNDESEVRITLRLPASLRNRLAKASLANNRSMNGEIVERLDWSFDPSTEEMTDLLARAMDASEHASRASRKAADLAFELKNEQAEKAALAEQIEELRRKNAALSTKSEKVLAEGDISALARALVLRLIDSGAIDAVREDLSRKRNKLDAPDNPSE